MVVKWELKLEDEGGSSQRALEGQTMTCIRSARVITIRQEQTLDAVEADAGPKKSTKER